MSSLRIGSLFSGIGGLELGLERAGLGHTVYQVERDPYCRHILAQHWPDAVRFDDVCAVGAHNLPPADVLCGGFPCTDLSTAGKLAGLGTENAPTARSGLWFEMRRIIDETRPTWVVVENVDDTWSRWLPVVRRSLHALGYASLPLRVRACDVGARHERARILVVAGPFAPDAGCGGRAGERIARHGDDRTICEALSPWSGAAAIGLFQRGVHGLPGGLDGPWRRAGWTGARLRGARIRALGNAVVPAVAEAVGRLIVDEIRARGAA